MRFALCLLLFVSGCGPNHTFTWGRISSLEPRQLPIDQNVQVWVHGKPLYWQQVVIGHDSVSGIPTYSTTRWAEPDKNGCKKCRRSVPLADVDSMRLRGDVSVGSVLGITATFIGMFYLLATHS